MKTVTLQEGHSVYSDEQIKQLLSELDNLRAEKANIISAVKSLQKIMPIGSDGSLDPMKLMGVIGEIQKNPEVLQSISFLGKYV